MGETTMGLQFSEDFFDILTKAFKYMIPFFRCDVLQNSSEI